MLKSAKKVTKKFSVGKKSTAKKSLSPSVLRSSVAILSYLSAVVFIASFFLQGEFFANLKIVFYGYFGLGMFVVPFFLICFGIFIQGFKFRIGQPHVVVGLPLVLFSLLALLSITSIDQAGVVGNRVWGGLNEYLPYPAGGVLVVVVLVVGLAVLFNTSLDIFFEKIFTAFGAVFSLVASRFLPSRSPLDIARSRIQINRGASQAATENNLHDQFFSLKRRDQKKDEEMKPKSVSHEVDVVESKKENPGTLGSSAIVNPNLDGSIWNYPPISIFSNVQGKPADRGDVKNNSAIIEKTLESFGIGAKVVEIDQGPAVTRYALHLAEGTKISRIVSLQSDLAMTLAAHTGEVRIEAPIPGKALVGIEIPNRTLEIVPIRAMLASDAAKNHKSKLIVPLGFDAACTPLVADITKMPHLLIAGTTNSGKSVMLNSIICSLMFRASPDEVKMILVDPKRVEMAGYNNIPHLLTPVIHDPDKTVSALKWAVSEMQRRYHIFSEVGARNIVSYNEMSGFQAIPYIVIIIDELADLMMYAPSEVEEAICRIAQMARAVGIHLILATQRPSVDVITGLIKANIPARMAFNVSSMVDSRVILDTSGAEKLLGRGDMLYLASDASKPTRIQAPWVKDEEITALVNAIKSSGIAPVYTEEVLTQPVAGQKGGGSVVGTDGEQDPMYTEAVRIVVDSGNASASFLQRKMKVGYARAARLLDQLEAAGIVGPSNGSKAREILRRGDAQ